MLEASYVRQCLTGVRRVRAMQLRGEGLSFAGIAKRLGIAESTAHIAVNPEAARKQREASERWRQRKLCDDPEWVAERRQKSRAEKKAHRARNGESIATRVRRFKRTLAGKGDFCRAPDSAIVAAYTGECHCCRRSAASESYRLAVDHDHETHEFRGWLCGNCNKGIGLLGDNLTGVENARRYLERATGS